MIHLRIVAPVDRAEMALELLNHTPSVTNVIYLPRAGQRPEGDAGESWRAARFSHSRSASR
jgi:hypothetical protein